MSLEAILEAIREPGQLEVQAIQARAEEEAAQILVQAQADAEQIRRTERAATAGKASRERARILHQAQMRAQQLVGDARAAAIDAALAEAARRLAALRSQPIYATVIKGLVEEALETVRACLADGEPIYLEADPRDEKLLEMLVRQYGPNVTLCYTLNCWGGVIAKDESERIVAINTLEERLQRAAPSMRGVLSAQLERGLAGQGG